MLGLDRAYLLFDVRGICGDKNCKTYINANRAAEAILLLTRDKEERSTINAVSVQLFAEGKRASHDSYSQMKTSREEWHNFVATN